MCGQGDLLSRRAWLMCQIVLKHVLLMKAKPSTLEMKHFVKERKDPFADHDVSHEQTILNERWTWTSEYQDNHIPFFENWFRKLRTIQIDMLFNKIYDKINHWILSVPSRNKWFGMLGTSNYVNYSIWNPKNCAKYDYHTGTWASSIARAGTSCEMEQRRTRNSFNPPWISFLFLITT